MTNRLLKDWQLVNFTQKIKSIPQIIKHRKLFRALLSNYLLFLSNPEKSVWGSITEDDEEGIKHAVKLASNHEGPIVEIGALFGHTTNLLASLKAKDTPLIAIENFSWNPFCLPPNAHRMFAERTIRYSLDHCSTQIFDGDADTFYSENVNLKPSLVFIDARHDYESVMRDIEWAVRTGCPVITGHDYIDVHPGVIKAVDETFSGNISVYGSVWVHESHEGEQVSGADA